ncbi:hypothetical protein FB645_005061 [Coemansia sp. IMI 203386]|nr:hypothetical protein FB645_005061 [Coemansia sp. IMI 203386]
MLSSSISSRLQQFQHQAADRHRDDLPQLKSERTSLGYSGQSPHTRIQARKGLAADLINKFNQLSATPSKAPSEAANSPARSHSSEGNIQKLLVSTSEPCKEKQAILDAQKHNHNQQQQRQILPSPLPSPSPASSTGIDTAPLTETCRANNQVREKEIIGAEARSTVTVSKATPASFFEKCDILSEESVVSFLALSSPAACPRAESCNGSVSEQARASPFLSDSELDRALSEIHEFSRDMNISLFEDDRN